MAMIQQVREYLKVFGYVLYHLLLDMTSLKDYNSP